jgi:four helix bundle protein
VNALEILKETEYISMEDYSKLINDNKELIKMLIASINTLKQKKSKA